MIVHKGLLHGMQFSICCQIINRDQFLAINLAEQKNAGIDRLINHAAIFKRTQRHGAGAAIAFVAAFLGALGFFIKPQIIKQCAHGWNGGKLHHLSLAQKTN